jgi:hypothetical protein
MPEKDPSNISLITYVWVFVLAIWGGVVHNIRKVREGVTKRFSITELLGDIMTSGFAGTITFYMCEAAGINSMLTAAMVGISGHMGARAIFLLEEWLRERFEK